jgi:hypothetical protein
MQLWQPGQNNENGRKLRRSLPRGTEPNHYHIIYTDLDEGLVVIRYKVCLQRTEGRLPGTEAYGRRG